MSENSENKPENMKPCNKESILVNMVYLEANFTEEQHKAIEKLFEQNSWEMDVITKEDYVEDLSRFSLLEELKRDGLCDVCAFQKDGKPQVGITYCLAKAVHSLARIRFANCPSGVPCHGVRECFLSTSSRLKDYSHRAVHLCMVYKCALVVTPGHNFSLHAPILFFFGGGSYCNLL